MRTIWKYPLRLVDEQTLPMPLGVEILDVQVQNGGLCLWALVDSEAEPWTRTIQIFGTGHDATNAADYIGTVQMGPLVWHVFDGFKAGVL